MSAGECEDEIEEYCEGTEPGEGRLAECLTRRLIKESSGKAEEGGSSRFCLLLPCCSAVRCRAVLAGRGRDKGTRGTGGPSALQRVLPSRCAWRWQDCAWLQERQVRVGAAQQRRGFCACRRAERRLQA